MRISECLQCDLEEKRIRIFLGERDDPLSSAPSKEFKIGISPGVSTVAGTDFGRRSSLATWADGGRAALILKVLLR